MANPSIQLGTNSNWAIKEDKLLAYKEYNDYFFNKEFDFSRGTSATYVAKDGLIKTAGIQPNIVNNGDFSELGSELVTNGDFATDSDWSKDSGWTIANGKASQDGTGTGNDGDIIQNSILDTSKIYKIVLDVVDYTQGTLYIDTSNIDLNVNGVGTYTLYFTPSSTNLFIRTRFSGFIGSIDNVSVKQVDPNDYWTLGTGWSIEDGKAVNDGSQTGNSLLQQTSILTLNKLYKVSYDLTVDSGQIYVRLGFSGQGAIRSTSGSFVEHITCSGNTNFDLFATSTYSGTVDNISVQEIQTDTPRIDFTNDTKGHLLLEPSSTNKVTYSNGFDDSSWDKTNVTVTENSETSPDGTNNAWLLQVTSDNDRHYLRASGLTTSTVSVSIFAKKGTTDYAYLFCGGSNNIQAIFDLSDGSVTDSGGAGSGSLTSASSVSLGNGWYRLQISGTFSTPPSNRVGILPYYQSTIVGTPATSWQGNGENIYIYGGMEENFAYSTSYIPTTGAASTRNADVCNNSGSAQDFNSEEGVLYAEIAALDNQGSSTSTVISINDGTVSNRIHLFYFVTDNTIYANYRSGGTTRSTADFTLSNTADINKFAYKWKSGDFALWVNGVEVDTDTNTTMIPSNTLNQLDFNAGGGGFNFYGKVRNAQVFTEALTDAELQELTS